MINKLKEANIDLAKLTRLYPAVLIDSDGEIAEMSLEWADLYGEKVTILKYILVFDFTPLNEEIKNRKVLEYNSKDALIIAINNVAPLL